MDIENFDMPKDDTVDYIKIFTDLFETAKRKRLGPPRETEPVFMYYGKRRDFENMSNWEILANSHYIGTFPVPEE